MPSVLSALCQSRSRALGVLFTCCAMAFPAGASPIKYVGYVVTDVALGTHKLHNADVTITFVTDTANIKQYDANGKVTTSACLQTSDPKLTQGDFCGIAKGLATVKISNGEESYDAKILPGQLLVAYDSINGGIGFSFFGGPNGFEPAYPFGLDSGGVFGQPDLTTPANLSGKLYDCIGFNPGGSYTCADPKLSPIKTDKGDLALYMPYFNVGPDGQIDLHYDGGSLNTGIFSIVPVKP